MINSVTITNHLEESILIEMRFPEKSGFLIENIEGLGPDKADINTTELSVIDGSIFDSSRIVERNIVFSISPFSEGSIESIRHKSYKYFPLKKRIKIRFDSDERNCEIYGYVESNEINIFSKKVTCIISVICPDPYFYDVFDQTTVFAAVTPLFEFPFSNESLVSKMIEISSLTFETTKTIYYEGEGAVGLVLYIHAVGSASNVEIINTKTLESIGINSTKLIALTGSDIVAGDLFIISTVKGDKYAILYRSGVPTNIFNALEADPTWFELEKGDNIFAYTATSGLSNLEFEVKNRIAYEGV